MPEIIITGPAGRLEARYQHSDHSRAPIALVLHPHPLYGGSMNNRVVYDLFYAFNRRGFSTMRFNFRGVGRSQGEFDSGIGELSDAAAALDWLQTYNQNASQCWIAGFSFGAWIAMQLLMRRPEINGFISVAPPANMFDFSFLAPCPASGLIINGTVDQVVPPADVEKLAERLKAQKGITIDHQTVPGANHFFETNLEDLIGSVETYLDKRMAAAAPDPAPLPEPKAPAEPPQSQDEGESQGETKGEAPESQPQSQTQGEPQGQPQNQPKEETQAEPPVAPPAEPAEEPPVETKAEPAHEPEGSEKTTT